MWPMRSDTDSSFRETQEASKQRIKAQKLVPCMDQLLRDNGKRFWMADEGNKIRNISVGQLGSEYFQGTQ